MGRFLEAEKPRQAAFKASSRWFSDAARGDGLYKDKPYPFCIPQDRVEENLFEGVRTPALDYFRQHGIGWHDGIGDKPSNHLCDSQVCCANFLFPLRENLEKAASILRKGIPSLRRVQQIEFEYTGPAGATEWLGEPPGGKRGQYRTSIDSAIWWQDEENKNRLTLVEWKYTEQSFGGCGGYASKGNAERDRCETVKLSRIQPKVDCYLATQRNALTFRRYWEHLVDAGISLKHSDDLLGCPFRGPFYQLMRQYLLAEYCRANLAGIESVDVMVFGFRGNQELLEPPTHLAYLGDTVISAWNSILTATSPLRHVTVETLLADAPGDEWREYVRQRYRV